MATGVNTLLITQKARTMGRKSPCFSMANDIQSIEDLLQFTGSKSTTKEASEPGEESAIEKFDEKMSEVRLKEKEVAAEKQAATLNIPYVNLKGFPISPEALRLVPKERSLETKAVCFLFTGPRTNTTSVSPTCLSINPLRSISNCWF